MVLCAAAAGTIFRAPTFFLLTGTSACLSRRDPPRARFPGPSSPGAAGNHGVRFVLQFNFNDQTTVLTGL